jgi:hypothetical protein
MNAIKNNPVTTEDVNIAEKIFGPDVATLKGKTTHHAPIPIIEDRIEIPREFCPLMDPLALKFRIQVNYASPQEHVPESREQQPSYQGTNLCNLPLSTI